MSEDNIQYKYATYASIGFIVLITIAFGVTIYQLQVSIKNTVNTQLEEVRSELRKSVEKATSKDLSEAVSIANSRLEDKINNISVDLREFQERLDVKIFMVMRGEHHSYAQPNWATVGCGDISGWLKSQCPNQKITQNMVYQRSGDKCGYTYVVAACVSK